MQIVGEALVSLGLTSAKHSLGITRKPDPFLAGLGSILLGGLVGLASAFLVSSSISEHPPLPGLSIFLAPPTVGIAMEAVGRWFDSRDRPRPPLTTFWGAAEFSFGMAVVRFLMLR